MLGFIHLFSLALAVFALAMLAPAAVGLLHGELAAAIWFLAMAGGIGFAAGGLILAFRGRPRRPSGQDGYFFAVALWCIPAVLGALPLMPTAGLDFWGAIFESTSGYTTTGATVLGQLSVVARSAIFWRAELQWLGGLATLVSIGIVLAPGGIGGLPGRHIGLLDPATPGGDYRLRAVIRDIAGAYGVLTVACLLLLLLVGIPVFDAFCLTFSTVSTGGFMPRDGNLAVYRNGAAEVVLMVFMLAGGTSVLWHRMLIGRRWQLLLEHRESYWVIGMAIAVGIAYAFAYHRVAPMFVGLAPLTTLRESLLAGISLVTTTGYSAGGVNLSLLPLTLVLLLALAGGGSFSTAGGLKYYRIGGMLVQARHELRRLIYPHGVRSTRFGSQPYNMPMMRAIWGHLFVSLLTVAVAALVVSVAGSNFIGALSSAIAAFANIGPLHGAGWGSEGVWQEFADMPGFAKLALATAMVLGRLEVVALLAAFNAAYWRS
jgi:trk system potassium uptake protein TrkH